VAGGWRNADRGPVIDFRGTDTELWKP
jgi:hypothetical protein